MLKAFWYVKAILGTKHLKRATNKCRKGKILDCRLFCFVPPFRFLGLTHQA